MKERETLAVSKSTEVAEQLSPLILVVSTKFDPHVDIIARKLNERHIPFIRFNTEDFPLRVSLALEFEKYGCGQKLVFPKQREIEGEQITAVWYRRPAEFELPTEFSPAVHIFAQEESHATIRGLWQILDCLWVNHPEKNRVAGLKLNQLKVAGSIGLDIPKTLVTNDPKEAARFLNQLSGKAAIKVLSRGLLNDDEQPSVVYTNIIDEKYRERLTSVRYTPTLFQEYITKEFELRITIVGNKVFAVEIHSQESQKAKLDWRRDTLNLPHREHKLPPKVEKKLLKLMRIFGLHFGAIDMILTPDGKYVFLEINPNGQWGWIEDLTDLPISEAMIELLLKGK